MPHRKLLEQLDPTRTADIAAGGSAFLAGAAWVAEVEPYITAGAGIVAIIAGVGAAWYHFERAKMLRLERRIKREKYEDSKEEK